MTMKQDFVILSLVPEAQNAILHGVVVAVSPMKRGANAELFEAKLTDGDTQMRVVGFSSGQRKRLASFEYSQEPVAIENCQVKKTRRLDELEVMLRSS